MNSRGFWVILSLIPCLLASTGTLQAYDLNKDGWDDIVLSNYYDGKSYNLKSYVYWGSPELDYSRRTELETHGARGASVFDFNQDGYLDIVFSNFSNGEKRDIPSYIYWGNAKADYTQRAELPTISAYGNTPADLNQDGFTDLVFSNYSDGDHAAIHSYVYWGDKESRFSRKLELATHGALGNLVADLNHDGYLDILFCSQNIETTFAHSYIYWGDKDSSYTRRTEIPTRYAYDVSASDLDSDGFIDLIFSDFSPEPSYIFWGDKDGLFKERTDLETKNATCNTVSDLDGDGNPDIVFSCYVDKGNHSIDSVIYWGAKDRRYTQKTFLPTHGAHGNAVSDLNKDGLKDIIFSNHHSDTSVIYWATDKRVFGRTTSLPSIGATGVCAGDTCAYGQALLTDNR